jgi:nucleoid-associated protein YgaU
MQTRSNRPIATHTDPDDRVDGDRHHRGRPHALGLLALGAALVASAGGLALLVRWCRELWAAVGAPGPASASELLLTVVVTGALAVGGWLWLGMVLAAAAELPGTLGRVVARCRPVTPRLARTAVAALLGLGLGVAGSGAALADPGAPPAQAQVVTDTPAAWTPSVDSDPIEAPTGAEPGAVQAAAPAAVSGVMTTPDPEPGALSDAAVGPEADPSAPDAPAGPSTDLPADVPSAGWRATAPLVRPAPTPDLGAAVGAVAATLPVVDAPSVVVRRGDTLWSIAARHLGPGASDAEVAAAWPAWFAANGDVIGDDPDVLRPGQVLLVPSGSSS